MDKNNDTSDIIVNTEQNTKSASFEEAIDSINFGIFHIFLIIVSGLVITNVFLESMSISFVLPVSSCDLSLTTNEKGILGAMSFAGIVVSSHLWGFLADTIGRRRILLPSLLIGFFVTVLSSFANVFWLLSVLRFINGFFISAGAGIVYAYLGEFHSEKHRSQVIMAASFIFGLGGLLLPGLAVIINQQWSINIPILNVIYKPWRLFIVICGMPGLISGLGLFFIPESPKFLFTIGKKDETLNIFKKMYRWNNKKHQNEFMIESITEISTEKTDLLEPDNVSKTNIKYILSSMWKQTVPLLRKKYARKTILICTLQFWAVTTAYGMYVWFPLILNSVMEFTENNPGKNVYICDALHMKNLNTSSVEIDSCAENIEDGTFIHSIMLEILYCLGYIVIGLVINVVDKKHILFLTLVICGISGCAAVYVNIPLLAVYLYVLLLLVGLSLPVINAIAVNLFPTNLRAMAVCLSVMTGRLGSVFGSNIIGILLDNYCEGAFLVLGISLILTGFLGYLIPKEKSDIVEEETHV